MGRHNQKNMSICGKYSDVCPTNFTVKGNQLICGTLSVHKSAKICSTENSGAANEGSLVVRGGVGVGKNLHVGEKVVVHSIVDSDDINNGSLVVAGGVGIAKRLNVGEDTVLQKNLQVDKSTTIGENLEVLSTLDSLDCDDGAVTVAGGVGIAKNINIGGQARVKQDLEVDGRVYQANHLLVPAGAVVPFAGGSAPGGYLLCDGASVSRAEYDVLFATIGTAYGSDSITTFKLPDLRGKMIFGVSGTHPLASSGGSETKTLTVNNIPAHTHTGTTDSEGLHTHSITDPGHVHGRINARDDGNVSNIPGQAPPGDANTNQVLGVPTESATTGISINADGAHTHTFTTNSTGLGEAFDVLAPFLSLNFIIKF